MKSSIALGGAAAIFLIVAGIYFLQNRPADTLSSAAGSSASDGSSPTPQYLFEHPDALKEAEKKCENGGDTSSLYCSNVHRAESLRMADQYRRATQPKGAAQ